jgi:hypothetical protein
MAKGKKAAAAWHWFPENEFENQMTVIQWDDSDERDENGSVIFPKDQVLIRCGNLARIHFRSPSAKDNKRHPRREKDTTITLNKAAAKESHIVFDPDHPGNRLYFKLKDSVRGPLAQRFWEENAVKARPLTEWAMLAGGRHATKDYPRIMGKPLGVMTAVVYFTNKKDDGASYYIHRMGEVSCYLPILVCDSSGRLWICGGNSTAPTPGITD